MTIIKMASALESDDDRSVSSLPLSDVARAEHISALNSSALFMLKRHLDANANSMNIKGYLKDFQGLSELMGFDSKDVQQFNMKDKTKSLLEAYGAKGEKSTIGKLWDFLKDLEREDVLNDKTLINKIEVDVEQYQQRLKELAVETYEPQKRTESPRQRRYPNNAQVNATISSAVDKYDMEDRRADEFYHITIGEVNTNVPELFDAFLSFSDGDILFVKELLRMLEDTHKLKLCVNARDLVIGTSCHTVTAKLIAERCRKIVIIVSPSFIEEPECDFQVKFAHALSPGSRSKKMIPILIEPCEVPLILKHVTMVDHTKVDLLDWFYGRLAGSLRAQSKAGGEDIFQWDEEDDTQSLAETFYPEIGDRPILQEIEQERAGWGRGSLRGGGGQGGRPQPREHALTAPLREGGGGTTTMTMSPDDLGGGVRQRRTPPEQSRQRQGHHEYRYVDLQGQSSRSKGQDPREHSEPSTVLLSGRQNGGYSGSGSDLHRSSSSSSHTNKKAGRLGGGGGGRSISGSSSTTSLPHTPPFDQRGNWEDGVRNSCSSNDIFGNLALEEDPIPMRDSNKGGGGRGEGRGGVSIPNDLRNGGARGGGANTPDIRDIGAYLPTSENLPCQHTDLLLPPLPPIPPMEVKKEPTKKTSKGKFNPFGTKTKTKEIK